jgi:cellulose synthase/poly-beta-1,6-N-acetylglucosamine synthase-like glycosyltransferase
MTVQVIAIGLATVALLVPSLVLAALAVISLRQAERRVVKRDAAGSTPLAVLIAAHDEELAIGPTLAAIASIDPAAIVHVMADNCHDRTAEIAALASGCVHERSDALHPGKAAALNRLTAEVLKEDRISGAFVFLDADARPEAGFFAAMQRALGDGADALQAKNLVADARAPLARLRELAFHLKCELRPMAYERLGVSVGLHGNGMTLRRRLLERYRWDEGSVVEDAELHLRLVRDGIRVRLASDAVVRSAMPDGFRGAAGQAVRWERGKFDLFAKALRLIALGLSSRRIDPVVAGYDVVIPPFSFLVAASAGVAAYAVVFGDAGLLAVALSSLAACALYVARGMGLARLGPEAAMRLVFWSVPYVSWKLVLLARTLFGSGRGKWMQARPSAGETT